MNARFTSWFRTVGWGLFGACSWTWCIGMYLPILLLRDYGWAGFLVFAIPNVIGCTAFGYVLKSRETSRRLVSQHASAGVWFSCITIAYHMFFAAFVLLELWPADHSAAIVGVTWPLLGVTLGVLVVLFGVSWALAVVSDRFWPAIASGVYAISFVVFLVLLPHAQQLLDIASHRRGVELAFLAPVIAFGFLLCPYLDLTFHRALQHSPSRHAFGVFGVAFAVMLVLTCVLWRRSAPALGLAALMHLGVQMLFTMAAHLRELRQHAVILGVRQRRLVYLLPWLAGLGFVAIRIAWPKELIGEDIYVRFLVFYGLVFPLYVLAFVVLRRVGEGRRIMVFYVAVVVLSLPCYEIGFGQRFTWVMLLPVAVFVLWILVTWPRREVSAP